MISNIDSSDIIAISAVVLALCAFVLTFYGIILNKKHNQLSVRPFFNLDTDDDPISLTLINRGQGNGIILSLNVKYNKNIRIINNQYELSGLFKEIWNSEPLPFTFDYKLPVGRAGVNVGESIEIF